MPLLVVLAWALFAVGVPLTLVGMRFRRRIAAFNARAVSTTGQIVGLVTRREHHGTTLYTRYYVQVAFTTGDGRRVQVSGPGHSAPMPIGSSMPLLYDPRAPEEVSFTGPRGQAGIATALALLGWTCLAAALALSIAARVA